MAQSGTLDLLLILLFLFDAVEGELIPRALVKARGMQAQAAEMLDTSRSNSQYKLKKFGFG